MIVITLSKVPPALRGVLTKWCQEIQTGVYVGRFSARIRDELWERIQRDIGSGEATIAFSAKNELGYQFRTTREDTAVIDYDGIPLVMKKATTGSTTKFGFSNAAKFRKAKHFSRVQQTSGNHSQVTANVSSFVSLDIETTGLNPDECSILSIGSVKYFANDEHMVDFYRLINSGQTVPKNITTLTGITDDVLHVEGVSLRQALCDLTVFIEANPIIGYNLHFDQQFLRVAYEQAGKEMFDNHLCDLLPVVKKTNRFLDNYKLKSVLAENNISNKQEHNSLEDARATAMLAIKLIKNGSVSI